MDTNSIIMSLVSNTTKENPMSAENIAACAGHTTADEVRALMGELMKQSDTITECKDGYYCKSEQDSILEIAEKNVLDKRISDYIIQNFDDVIEAQLFIASMSDIAKRQKKKTEFQNLTKGILRIIAADSKEIIHRQKLENAQRIAAEQYKNAPDFIKTRTTKNGEVKPYVDCPLLAQHIRENYKFKLVRNPFSDNTDIYFYSNRKGIYKRLSDDVLQSIIKLPIEKYDKTLVKSNDLREVMILLKTDRQSCTYEDFNSNEDIIVFNNGVLNIKTGELTPHSPEHLSTISIPCDYKQNGDKMPTLFEAWETAKINAPVFTQYLIDLSGGDKGVIKLILEFMGVAISNVFGHRYKSSLFLVGKGDTGKSQLFLLIQKLLGEDNCAKSSLEQLESRFGKVSMFGKRFVDDPDISFATIKELATFKQATGGDRQQVEQKGKDPFDFVFKGLLAFGCNRLPQFCGDRGEWVYNRIIPVECKNVIPKNRQNKHIVDDMYKEREEIVSLLVPFLMQTVNNNYSFDIPDCCITLKNQYKEDNDPIRQFFAECCKFRDGKYKVIKDKDYSRRDIYATYKYWYKENISTYYNSVSEKKFKDGIVDLLSECDIAEKDAVFDTRDGRYYIITLNDNGIMYFNELMHQKQIYKNSNKQYFI